jgi:hypothetical protein
VLYDAGGNLIETHEHAGGFKDRDGVKLSWDVELDRFQRVCTSVIPCPVRLKTFVSRLISLARCKHLQSVNAITGALQRQRIKIDGRATS